MLVARLRPDNPLGAARLTCDDRGEAFVLEGVGAIAPVKLLDPANRRQLEWAVDEATREWLLAAASTRIRRDRENRATGRAAATVAAATAAASKAGDKTLGIPAGPMRLEAPEEIAHQGSRAVGTELPVAEPQTRQTAGVAPLRPRRLRAWAIVSVACVAAAALGLLFPHQIARLPGLWSARQVTSYTELYFTDSATLPTRLNVREPSPVSFTVFNHEGRERVYEYVVTLAGPRGSSVAERGSIVLKDNAGAGRVVNVVPTGLNEAYVITVTIIRPLQTIHFTGHS